MKRAKVHLVISTIICAATLLLFLTFSGRLPETIPIQIGVDGNVSNAVPKPLFVYGIPVIFVAANLFRGISKLRKNEGSVLKYYVVPIIAVILSAVLLLFGISFNN